jgi:hypothetical protein
MKDVIELKICPICGEMVNESKYLEERFKDTPEVNYLAHMITHYRHHHITSWNKCWGTNGGYYRGHWFGDYEEEKKKVNERAKRQIIRKGKKVLQDIGIKPFHFMELANTEDKTMELALKVLG